MAAAPPADAWPQPGAPPELAALVEAVRGGAVAPSGVWLIAGPQATWAQGGREAFGRAVAPAHRGAMGPDAVPISAASPPHGEVALWVGAVDYVPADPDSLLQQYVCRKSARRLAAYRDAGADAAGADVPADWVPEVGLAVAQRALRHGPMPDAVLAPVAQWVDWARKTYAAGGRLAFCPELRARASVRTSWPQATAAWRRAGTDWARLAHAHRDPHAAERVRQRLGPYRALLPQLGQMMGQLGQLERQLRQTPGAAKAHLERLAPTIDQLYAACALKGVLAHPKGAAMLAEPSAEGERDHVGPARAV